MSDAGTVIYVVDDDEPVRISLRRLLKSMGFQAKIFTSAQEFLRQEALAERGCIILDIRMPEMDGPTLQKELVASGITLPIIFMSAYPDDHLQEKMMQSGALAFLRKPFTDSSLQEALQKALA